MTNKVENADSDASGATTLADSYQALSAESPTLKTCQSDPSDDALRVLVGAV